MNSGDQQNYRPDQVKFDSLGELRAELPGAHLRAESFADNAAYIFTTIKNAENEGLPKFEGYRRAIEMYVDDPENDRLLALQADIILHAPDTKRQQDSLEQIKTQIATVPTPELREQSRALTRQLCVYNHAIRDLILASPDTFSRAELENWLEKGSGGNAVWARKLISGISAEVAAMRLMEKTPGVVDVIPSSVDEDLKGVDMTIKLVDKSLIPVDIKYGGNEPENGVMPRGRTLEVGLKKDAVIGFEINPIYADSLISSIRYGVGYGQAI